MTHQPVQAFVIAKDCKIIALRSKSCLFIFQTAAKVSAPGQSRGQEKTGRDTGEVRLEGVPWYPGPGTQGRKGELSGCTKNIHIYEWYWHMNV